MKIAIIGGGIAGTALGIFLLRKQHDVYIYEREPDLSKRGNAFLMQEGGIELLSEIKQNAEVEIPGNIVDTFIMKQPDSTKLQHIKIAPWKCMNRVALMDFLYDLFPSDRIITNKTFSHFEWEGDKATSCIFADGSDVVADIYIGADGGNSKIRESLFGSTQFTDTKVKEILGNAYHPELAKANSNIFTKYVSTDEGLAFGFIPTNDSDLVWYMQYDSQKEDVPDRNAESIKAFCSKKLEGFSEEVKALIDNTSFTNSYIWTTKDFDTLHSFHKGNVALIGDAAHLALPFTSAGTTNAIVDAKILSLCIEDCDTIDNAFENYYQIREDVVSGQTQLGRDLQNDFLEPSTKEKKIPLLSGRIRDKKKLSVLKPIQILYFTDPICSTCWIMQPYIRKFMYEYESSIFVEFHMGGLLPSWDELKKGIIKVPGDAAKHWDDVAELHNMPLDGDVWLEDPIYSSYPPSIAFKAAQIQSYDKALVFYRKLREWLFIEKKNISNWTILEQAALESGLDIVKLKLDFYNGQGLMHFTQDLELAKKYIVTAFPTLLFFHNNKLIKTIRSAHTYEELENAVHEILPQVKKREFSLRGMDLFKRYMSLSEKEYAYLSNISIEDAKKELLHFEKSNLLFCTEGKNGALWTTYYH